MTQKAKIIAEFDEEFKIDYPAFTIEVVSSNPNLTIDITEKSPFTIKFKVINNSGDHQLVAGSVGDARENLIVFGKTLHEGEESKVSKSVRGDSTNTIEISSDWIQDKNSAEMIAEWVAKRVGVQKLKLDIEMFGTPVLEIGDIIKVYHYDIEMSATKEFVVNSIRLNWSDGLNTSISAVEL